MINSSSLDGERKRYLAINCVEFSGTELAFVLTCCWTAAAAAVLHLPKDEDLILYFGLFFCVSQNVICHFYWRLAQPSLLENGKGQGKSGRFVVSLKRLVLGGRLLSLVTCRS